MTDPEADVIREAGHAEAETRYRLQFAAEQGTIGWNAGYTAGYQRARAEMAQRWNEIAAPVMNSSRSPSHAELEERRWGPGGREHFADPRPGDFLGRTARQAQLEAGREAEPEAGAG